MVAGHAVSRYRGRCRSPVAGDLALDRIDRIPLPPLC